MRDISEETKENIKKYLTNVLDMPVVYWDGRPTIEQKDRQRRKLHNILAKELELSDRDIIGKCAEAAYNAYLKSPFADSAYNAFIHELAVQTGENPVTPEQEAGLAEYSRQLEDGHKIGDRIYDKALRKFYMHCATERKEHYDRIRKECAEELSKKTPDELLELAKAATEKYLSLCDEQEKHSHQWHLWANSMDFPCNGFGLIYYEMEHWFRVSSFYHDRFRNTELVKTRIREFTGQELQIKWFVDTLATLHTAFDAMREYLDTPWEELVKVFMSFKDLED